MKRPSYGTVYKLTHTDTGWVLTTLYRFDAYDGDGSEARVMIGPDGSLYGTTYYGGSAGYGTVYRLQPPADSAAQSSVRGPRRCCTPFRAAVAASIRSMATWHSTRRGISTARRLVGPAGGNCQGGCGVVYKLTRSGGSWTFGVLYPVSGRR